MDLETSLKEFGLSSKEARVYLAAIELGESSVLKITKKADIKRPTTYIVLESLIGKGLISRTPRGAATLYLAEDPEILITTLKDRTAKLQNVLPELKSIYNKKVGKPKICFYEGKNNIKQVWLNDVFKHDKIDFISSITDLFNKYPDMMEVYLELAGEKILTRELVTRQPNDLEYAKKYTTTKQQIKILPKDYEYSMDITIFKDKVFLVSIKDDFAVLIESSEVYKSFQSLYNLAWKSSE